MPGLINVWMTMMMGVQCATEYVHDPLPDPRAIVRSDGARFIMLSPTMIRMEWSPTGAFVDTASQVIVHRRLHIPQFESEVENGWLVIRTGELTLRYRERSGPFTADNLSVEFQVDGRTEVWTPGRKDTGNLGGTVRTLDNVSGACPLPPGLLSREGWTLLDDSKSLVFDDSEWAWLKPRTEKDAIDWYFIVYGRDYPAMLRNFTGVAGRVPLPPRYVFGAWWSRYWAYSDAELRELVGQFREHDVPLDVLVIDMDWHMDGWTGYTWNPEYFPDPDGFLKWVRGQGLKTTLNLHPADGVKKHEEAFRDVAVAMRLDPETVDHVPFDCTDPRYMDAYFKYLHHPLERQGVDFWWIDWQQGTQSKLEGIDPLWWLNHLHWTDMERNPDREGKRPLIFSRWGGLGNHRYQIGFSGDTHCNWQSLDFQPSFTATAGNVGFGYWSHDIGGHQPGPVEPELYARWIQWGAMSPILRTHTTKRDDAERRIWTFPPEVFDATRRAFHLRYELLPYIYTAARQCYDTSLPLCRPLYYHWPELEESYQRTDEYMFGDDLLVAPVAVPMNPELGYACVSVWLPPGEWTNWFTGRTYSGPTEILLTVPLDECPIFARAGAIIPTMPKMQTTDAKPVDPLILNIFPGESGEVRIYEDDGLSNGYQTGQCAWMRVTHRREGDQRHITIHPVEGSFNGMLKERAYEIRLRGSGPIREATMGGEVLSPATAAGQPGFHFDPVNMECVIRTPPKASTERIELVLSQFPDFPILSPTRGRTLERISQLIPTIIVHHSQAINTERMSDPTAVEEHLKASRLAMNKLPLLIQQSQAEPSVIRKAIALFLGLSCQVQVGPSLENAGQLMASAKMQITNPDIDLDTVQGEISLTTTAPQGADSAALVDPSDAPQGVRAGMKAGPLRLDKQLPAEPGVIRTLFKIHGNGWVVEYPHDTPILPSINAWWIAGPFEAPFEEGLETVFSPEAKVDLLATYPSNKGTPIAWRKIERTISAQTDVTSEFFVSFTEVFGSRQYDAVAYAFSYLHAVQATDAVLAIGSDDGLAVWVNGKEVHRNDIGRPYSSKADRVPVRLNTGANTLLLKINQGGGDWAFCAHVETAEGKPHPAVRPSLSP